MSQPAEEAPWAPPAGPAEHAPASWKGLLRTARPKQWLKNVLVFAAPGAAGALGRPGAFGRTVLMFALFCLASSGCYFMNDAADVEADRLHPTKRRRPVAAGLVPVRQAWAVGVGLVLTAVAGSVALGPRAVLVVGLYALITLAYSLGLKREPVLEMGVLTGGFILRAAAGGVATHVPLSDWFLIVASFGSLFMVGGKRYAEYEELGERRSHHRSALAGYSLSYLRYVRSVSSSVTVAAYCLWAFEKAGTGGHAVPGALWFQLSIAPFVMALLRYALVLDQGGGGAPEDVVLGDRVIQGLGVIWVLLFSFGVYGV